MTDPAAGAGAEPATTGDGAAGLASELLDLATALAVEAGGTITAMHEAARRSPTTKSSPTDPVTAADRAAEEIVVAGILRHRPNDGIVGEEGTDRAGTSGVDWFIDPIDGTTNYLYGIPAYAVSIAAAVGDRTVAGVVNNPAAGELFAARLGGGATCNGRPITVSRPRDLSSALVATGFGYLAERRRRQAAVVAELLPRVRDIRRFGSAALDLCAVACGRVDAYYEAGLNAWDHAAGALIATEAGARCLGTGGGPPDGRFLLAVAPTIGDELGALLTSLGAEDVVP